MGSAEKHFVIDDDEDDVIDTPTLELGDKKEQEMPKEDSKKPSDDVKENPKLAAAVAEATKQLGETYDDSSSDEEE